MHTLTNALRIALNMDLYNTGDTHTLAHEHFAYA